MLRTHAIALAAIAMLGLGAFITSNDAAAAPRGVGIGVSRTIVMPGGSNRFPDDLHRRRASSPIPHVFGVNRLPKNCVWVQEWVNHYKQIWVVKCSPVASNQ